MAIRQSTVSAVLTCLWLVACGGSSPTRPSPAISAPVSETWIISGQSNAVDCTLPIGVPYPGCTSGFGPTAASLVGGSITLTGWAKGSEPLEAWAPNGEGWRALDPILRSANHPTTLLWWQGEADAVSDPDGYASRLQDLLARVRAETRPDLDVVIVGLLDAPFPEYRNGYAAIRRDQQAVASSDPHAVFVSTHGVPLNPESPYHTTADGYREVGRRIATALRAIRH